MLHWIVTLITQHFQPLQRAFNCAFHIVAYSLTSLWTVPCTLSSFSHLHASHFLLQLPFLVLDISFLPVLTIAHFATMSTIQNLKNFIRHGKQARLVTPHAEPTTNVSTIHAQQQRQPQGQYPPAAGNLDAIDSKHSNGQAASHKAAEGHAKPSQTREAEIERIVAEERQSKSKMPTYPGLERWILLEKMGDGAFSNVYRARDSTGQFGEVAIKVVRKFEMNSNQV